MGNGELVAQEIQWVGMLVGKYLLGIAIGMILALLLWMFLCVVWDWFKRWWNVGK